MKKIIKFIMLTLTLVVIVTVISLLKPSISRTCKIKDSRMKIKIPYAYEEVYSESENVVLNLYNKNGIKIKVSKFQEGFWSSGDTNARVEEYLKVMSSMNYDSEIKNVKRRIIEKTEDRLGMAEFDLRNISGSAKNIAIITNDEVGNFVIEIEGPIELMEAKRNEIEKIIKSIKL